MSQSRRELIKLSSRRRPALELMSYNFCSVSQVFVFIFSLIHVAVAFQKEKSLMFL